MPKKISQSTFYYSCCCLVICLLFLVEGNLHSYLFQDQVLGSEINIQKNNELIKEKDYWENIVGQNSTYLPGYIELANLNLELGDRNSAIINLIKARQINPNSNEVKHLESILGI
jgi:hypothetical protein